MLLTAKVLTAQINLISHVDRWIQGDAALHPVYLFLAKYLTESLRIPGEQDEEIRLDLKYKAQRGWYFYPLSDS